MASNEQTFADAVMRGLSVPRGKAISSKWFYDEEGSRIFQEISKQSWYQLTAWEDSILENDGDSILAATNLKQAFNLVELGCGDGHKTSHLIRHSRDLHRDFAYIPIDISATALEECRHTTQCKFPSLEILPIHKDFSEGLDELKTSGRAKLILFLGSNIGNMQWEDALLFLGKIRAEMRSGDFLLIGFDLVKDIRIMQAAYDDPGGLTAQFNLNLLTRINRELGGQFDLKNFKHYAHFNSEKGAMESHLVSTVRQDVFVEKFCRTFRFEVNETIHTESSGKYTVADVATLAACSGFSVVSNFFDNPDDVDGPPNFLDSLWRRD